MIPPLAALHSPDVTFLFNDWAAVLRVLFIAVAGYVTLLVLLRASGQRTLAKLTSFDLVITVTIGSAFGRVITAREVAIVEVLAAFGSLVLLQMVVARIWRSTPRLSALITPTPAMLYYGGEVIGSAMRRFQLREDDLLAAARKEGIGSLEEVRAILLEGDGTLAVLPESGFGDGGAIEHDPELSGT